MSYQNISRRYRPQCFQDVVGQEHIVTTLKHAVHRATIAPVYLFSGAKGTGKTTLARIFAKAVNCHNPHEGEPCNQCQACMQVAQGNCLDLLEIDGASHRGIEDIRSLNETIDCAPFSNRYKIYLIDEVHMLTKEAFNALLKTMEEPPAHVIFCCATTEAHKIPETIMSRCQHFALHRIHPQLMLDKLKKIALELNVSTEEKALNRIISLAYGSLRDAESLMDQVLAYQSTAITDQDVVNLLGLVGDTWLHRVDHICQSACYEDVFELVDQLFSEGKNPQHFIQELIRYFRECLKQNCVQKHSFYTTCTLISMLEVLAEAEKRIKETLHEKIFVEMLLLSLIQKAHLPSYESLIARLEALETAPDKIQTTSVVESKVTTSNSVEPLVESSKIQPQDHQLLNVSRVDTLLQFSAQELKGKLSRL